MSTPGRKPGKPTFAERVAADGGDEIIFRRIASGELVTDIMESYGYSRDMMYQWINQGGEARRQAFEDAKRQSAEALAEQAGRIIDAAADATSTAAVMVARERMGYRKWLAGIRDRETFGERAGAEIQVNIGQLHLDALRARGSVRLAQQRRRELQEAVIEAEVEEIAGELGSGTAN